VTFAVLTVVVVTFAVLTFVVLAVVAMISVVVLAVVVLIFFVLAGAVRLGRRPRVDVRARDRPRLAAVCFGGRPRLTVRRLPPRRHAPIVARRGMSGARAVVGIGVRYGDDETVRSMLVDTETWAVVGLSDNPARVAYDIARYLRRHGKRVIPVHPSKVPFEGEQGYARVTDIPFKVDVVDVFVRSELAGPVVDDAIAAGAGGVWLQLGVRDEAAAARAEQAGLRVVMDTCPKIEAHLAHW